MGISKIAYRKGKSWMDLIKTNSNISGCASIQLYTIWLGLGTKEIYINGCRGEVWA